MLPGRPFGRASGLYRHADQGMNMLTRLCLALGLSVLSAPSLAKDAELPMPLAEQLPVEVQLTQHELAVDVPDYSSGMATQFGLVGVLIGSMVENSQSKKGEDALLPVRNLMVDYTFEQRLVTALQAGLPGSGIAGQPVVNVSHLPWEGRSDLQSMPPRALVIRPRYALDETMSTMYVKLQVTLEDRQVRNGAVKTKVAFTRPYTFRSTLANATPGQTGPWTALGAERVGQLMDQSVDQAVAIMLYDFSAEGRQQWTQKVKGRTEVSGRFVPGRVERRTPDAVWVRAGNKRMQNLTAYQTLRPGHAPALAYLPTAAQPVAAVTAAYVDASPLPAAQPADVVAAVVQPPVGPTAAVQQGARAMAAPLAAPAASRNTFWEQHRPKDGAGAPATTP